MTIGQLAKTTGMDSQTIRYYERIGIISNPVRTDSNYRTYDLKSVDELNFVKRAKQIGFSLNDIKTLVAMSDGRIRSCKTIRTFAESRLLKVKNQIVDLMAIEKGLEQLISECRLSDTITSCPILDCLSKEHVQGV